jgi:hypothetical protein
MVSLLEEMKTDSVKWFQSYRAQQVMEATEDTFYLVREDRCVCRSVERVELQLLLISA